MIKILKISNCHLWDNVEMSVDNFENLIGLLQSSGYSHTITYVSNGVEYVTWVTSCHYHKGELK